MANEKEILQKARVLIQQRKFNKARTVLSEISHNSTAQQWLKRLDKIAPANPQTDSLLAQARELIKQKRYDEARKILRNLPANETAKKWLIKLDEIYPPISFPESDSSKTSKKFLSPLWIATGLVTACIMLCCFSFILSALLSPDDSTDNNIDVVSSDNQKEQSDTFSATQQQAFGEAMIATQAPTEEIISGQTITVDGTCTLNNAIKSANQNASIGGCSAGSGTDTIALTGDVELKEILDTTEGDNGLEPITSAIIIEGNGFTIQRIAEEQKFRIFYVTDSGDLTLQNVTVKGGESEHGGGGIYSQGQLTLLNAIITENIDHTSRGYSGGGVLSKGVLIIMDSQITNNLAMQPREINNGGGICHVSRGNITIRNSTIRNNTARGEGGGIYILLDANDAIGLIENSDISDNISDVPGTSLNLPGGGGGIYIFASEVIIRNSIITNNIVYAAHDSFGREVANPHLADAGGGIFSNSTKNVEITDTIISGNSAAQGGGIYIIGNSRIRSSEISNNGSMRDGGGVFYAGHSFDGSADNTTLLNISDSTISNNTSDWSGGGFSINGPVLLVNSTISNNSAKYNGGAIYTHDDVWKWAGILQIMNCTISSNSAESNGGAIYIPAGVPSEIINTTIQGNTAAEQTGGIYNEGIVNLINTIVANNKNGDCHIDGDFNIENILDSDDSCLDALQITGLDSNLSDNGGLTMTHALLEGSNAIDSGSTNYCPDLDQRGATRSGVCDIGAFEFNGSLSD